MDDMTLCPICGSKMRNLNMDNKFSYHVDKTYSWIERSCHTKRNHYVQLVANKQTKKIDYLNFSLDPKYSKFIEINFIKGQCILSLLKDKTIHTINIPKIIEPDFPELIKLKQQVNLYSLFS